MAKIHLYLLAIFDIAITTRDVGELSLFVSVTEEGQKGGPF